MVDKLGQAQDLGKRFIQETCVNVHRFQPQVPLSSHCVTREIALNAFYAVILCKTVAMSFIAFKKTCNAMKEKYIIFKTP